MQGTCLLSVEMLLKAAVGLRERSHATRSLMLPSLFGYLGGLEVHITHFGPYHLHITHFGFQRAADSRGGRWGTLCGNFHCHHHQDKDLQNIKDFVINPLSKSLVFSTFILSFSCNILLKIRPVF